MRHAAALCGAGIILFLFLPLSAQEEREIELTAQGILAKVDRIMHYPSGLIRGRIKHVYPNGKSFKFNIEVFCGSNDFLFTFSSKNRDDEMKILYNQGTEDIWVYKIHSLQLFHKMGIDRFDPMLNTNFSFIDLSNFNLQSNYTAKIVGDAVVKGKESYKLILNPIYKGGTYGVLTLYVEKEDSIPLKIDFHDRDKAIFKTLSIAKVRKMEGRHVPVRYDMLNIREGTVSILNFFSFDTEVKYSKNVFRSDSLER